MSPAPVSVRSHDRAVRMAGTAAALLLAVLAARLGVLVQAEEQWLALHYSPPEATAKVTRLMVGLPVCVAAVFLVADRSGHRAGVLLLAAGAVWIAPSTVFDVLAYHDGGAAPWHVALIVLGAAGIAGRPLTVLLLVLFFLRDAPLRRRHRVIVAIACAACVGYAVIWAISVPGVPPFASPWSETSAGEWARGLEEPAYAATQWVGGAVTAAVTGELAGRAARASARRDRRVWALLAAAYPVCAFLLLWDVGEAVATIAARAVGSMVWIAVICLTVARTGMWRLERTTCHRLADTFVLTILAAVAVCLAVLAWAAFPAQRSAAAFATAGAAFAVGWIVRPMVRRTSRAVERAFYGPRARPHEAAQALAVRLRQAPHPGDVPEQICRSVVEDLGVSGAVVEVDTRLGPRRLAAFGAPVGEPRQVFDLRHHGQVMGRLTVARGGASTPTRRDSALLSLLADQAGPALAALRLGEEAQAAREGLVLAREEERRRLRREIHDGLGPQLAAVQLRLGIAQACGEPYSGAAEQLRLATEGLGEALTELRRITAGLTPAALVEHGLLVATRTLAHRLSTDAVRVTVTCPDTPLPAMPPAVETAAYRIAAEAVTNAVRHAGARCVRVAFGTCPEGLSVTVADDGTGFDTGAVGGTGLPSIVERAEEIGGTSLISSGPGGTTVRATLPISPSVGAAPPHEPPREPSHEPSHRISRHPSRDPSDETRREAANENPRDIAREATNKTPHKTTNKPTNKARHGATNENPHDVTREATHEATNKTPHKTTNKPTNKARREATNENPHEVGDEDPHEVTKEIANGITRGSACEAGREPGRAGPEPRRAMPGCHPAGPAEDRPGTDTSEDHDE